MSAADVDEAWLSALGSTLVVAPHPDDESLGCGGLIARLRDVRLPVAVVLVSDGTMSHPRSRRFSREKRHAVRVAELREALAELGVEFNSLLELGCADAAVPRIGEPGFHQASAALAAALRWSAARTLVVPWRRDPHPDHRAASEIARAANASLEAPARLLEYGVWLNERGNANEQPLPDEALEWRLDINQVVERKLRAIDCHRSQHGQVIDDDPTGFVLSTAMRARCAEPVERYYECWSQKPRMLDAGGAG